jgi:hypothetical protein
LAVPIQHASLSNESTAERDLGQHLLRVFQTPPAQRAVVRYEVPLDLTTGPHAWSRIARGFQQRHPVLAALDPAYIDHLQEMRTARRWISRLKNQLKRGDLRVLLQIVCVLAFALPSLLTFISHLDRESKTDRFGLRSQPAIQIPTRPGISEAVARRYSIDVIREQKRRKQVIARDGGLPYPTPVLGEPYFGEATLRLMGVAPEALTAFDAPPRHIKSLSSLRVFEQYVNNNKK